MSVPQPWPPWPQVGRLMIAIMAWLDAALAVLRASTRADPGIMGWPLAVLWDVMGAGWFW